MYNNYLLTNNVVLKKTLYVCTIYVFNFRTKAKKGHVKGGGGEIMTVIMHLMVEQ